MWKKELLKKRKGQEADLSLSAPPPIKKNTSTTTRDREEADRSDDIFVCDISAKRRVSVRKWKGSIVVDIREFYEKEGNKLPGKKGISLNMDQWEILRDHVGAVDKALAEKS